MSAGDYYPFGMGMGDRKWSLGGYRYGFNGQEKSDEVVGEGNHNTAQYWEYDTRIGFRWDTDPVLNAGMSPCAIFSNNPIAYNDPNGACPTCPVNAKEGDTNSWGGLSFTFSNGSWSHTLNDVNIVAVSLGKSSSRFQNWANNVGASGITAHSNLLYQEKINGYQDGFSRGIYGVGSDGKTALPQSIKDRLRGEANAEAYSDLKDKWASDASGWDPNSLGFYFNPIAWSGYYSTRAEAVTSRSEGYSLITSVSINVGLQWIGEAPISRTRPLIQIGGLYRRGGNVGGLAELEVPMQMRTVKVLRSKPELV
ncbi:hypothetical protein BW716_34090 [[Flexibacter] sp. ATCC 35208]|nr:hypothetical protein BW716_34090 [[Flexibacter] sp. ATCC 35208]